MPMVDLPLDQRNIIITRSKEGILDIKKIFTSKGANVFDLPAISIGCLLYTSPSPRDYAASRMPSSA